MENGTVYDGTIWSIKDYNSTACGSSFITSGNNNCTKEVCRSTYHRYYSLEPQAMDDGSRILVISICSNCGDVLEHRTSIK